MSLGEEGRGGRDLKGGGGGGVGQGFSVWATLRKALYLGC